MLRSTSCEAGARSLTGPARAAPIDRPRDRSLQELRPWGPRRAVPWGRVSCRAWTLWTVIGLAGLAGCDRPPVAPTGGGGAGGGGNDGGVGTTITITASGVSPRTLIVSPGTRVLVVNNDIVDHNVSSDPHPIHTDCIEINQVGFIQPGQTKETGNLNTARTCGFHDHDRPFDTTLQGEIIIR